MILIHDAKFSLGQVVATPGVLDALSASGQSAGEFFVRHARGDWGELNDNDKSLNDQSLVDGSRLLSAYCTPRGVRLWIITESVDDQGRRAATTLLLPSEY